MDYSPRSYRELDMTEHTHILFRTSDGTLFRNRVFADVIIKDPTVSP